MYSNLNLTDPYSLRWIEDNFRYAHVQHKPKQAANCSHLQPKCASIRICSTYAEHPTASLTDCPESDTGAQHSRAFTEGHLGFPVLRENSEVWNGKSLLCVIRGVRGPRSLGIPGSARARLKGRWQPACPEPLLQAPPQVLDSLHREVADFACPKSSGCGQGCSQVSVFHTSNHGQ